MIWTIYVGDLVTLTSKTSPLYTFYIEVQGFGPHLWEQTS